MKQPRCYHGLPTCNPLIVTLVKAMEYIKSNWEAFFFFPLLRNVNVKGGYSVARPGGARCMVGSLGNADVVVEVFSPITTVVSK